MKMIHNDEWYRKLYRLRLWRHYLMEAKRLVRKAQVIEDGVEEKQRPKLRIV